VFTLRQLPARGRDVGKLALDRRRSLEQLAACDDSAAANLGDFNRSFDEQLDPRPRPLPRGHAPAAPARALDVFEAKSILARAARGVLRVELSSDARK
jgi:hypothetical protein